MVSWYCLSKVNIGLRRVAHSEFGVTGPDSPAEAEVGDGDDGGTEVEDGIGDSDEDGAGEAD
jgi:hypothetical protein